MGIQLAHPEVHAERRGETWYLRSPAALAYTPRRLGDDLRESAARYPDRDFLIERRNGVLQRTRWGEALARAEGIAGWLVDEHPRDVRVAALSVNSIEQALLMLGCFLAGVPFIPVSQAYSLLSQDFQKLRVVFDKVAPSVVFAEPRNGFERALAALDRPGTTVLDAASVRELGSRGVSRTLAAREASLRDDDVAKILFTSGSTGSPKGVPNTHKMMICNQRMVTACWPFLDHADPPTLVDWLPWSHTFGGNHNFNMVLCRGGTLLVDDGRPTPSGIEGTLRNLLEVSPSIYFNVPAGYAALVPRLERDSTLATAFFSRLEVLFYAAAALPADLWDRLRRLADRYSHRDVFLTTAWGSTETSPLATSAHFVVDRPGNIGLPAPGVTLKLVPSGTKREVRVRGPNVMSGYWEEPELTAQAFDEEGFYRMGDAVRFADEEHPERGLFFDGRIAEDFKLASGTWVSVTNIRTGVLAAASGVLADIVVCGHDKAALGIVAWPSVEGCRTLVGDALPMSELVSSELVREQVRKALRTWNEAHPRSSTFIARAALLADPPSIDAGEITDKGYINQRATLESRAAAIKTIFAPEPAAHVLCMDRSTPDWNARSYHVVSGPQFAWGLKVLARTELRGDEDAMDAGCGTGRLTALLLDGLPRGTVVAADRSPGMIEEARGHLRSFEPRVRFHVGDLLELPFEQAFDLVFSTATFHWIPDHERLFRVLARTLRRGGRLCAQCGGHGNLQTIHDRAAEVMRRPRYRASFLDWKDVWQFSNVEDAEARLSAAGFREIEVDLEPAPTEFPDREAFAAFLETVVLRNHLAMLEDPADRRAFLEDIVANAPLSLDYVRLNLRAKR